MNCNFTLQHYKECIELARDKGYTIKPVKDFATHGSQILMRHDIDFSLEYAYELASFEYDLGVKSSYYVYLHSPTYNALSPKSMGMIKAMKGMGHEIGFHYDSNFDIGGEDMLVASLVEQSIKSVTHHFPASNDFKDYDYLTNPNNLNLKYISDSGRNWRSKCMCNWIGKENLHINTHAEWWVSDTDSREQMLNRLYTTLESRLAEDMRGIKQMLFEYERDVINK